MNRIRNWFTYLWHAAGFVLYYCSEVVLSNLRVAYDIITPRHMMKPGIVSVPLSPSLTDLQILMLANLITMTPGTLCIDVSPDRKRIYIHVMFLDDPEQFRKSIKEKYERRIQRVF